jgi:hypothetical protein
VQDLKSFEISILMEMLAEYTLEHTKLLHNYEANKMEIEYVRGLIKDITAEIETRRPLAARAGTNDDPVIQPGA